MALPFPARWPLRIARGAAAGAATAVALVLAEVAASLLMQAALPPRAWAFQALYWIPCFAIAGALGALLIGLSATVSALVWLPAAVYCAAVVNQDLLAGRPRLAPVRLAAVVVSAAAMAAAAWATERVLARRALPPRSGLLLRMALLLPLVAAVHLSARALDGARGAGALAVPGAVAAAGALAAAALAPLAARLSVRSALALAAGLAIVVAVSAAWRAGQPVPGTLRDDPQPAAPPPGAAPLPNVVLIVLDTVRASSLSCYGYERKTTPHLDAFAAQAVRFTAATTVSPWSVPAHASLFTGLFAPEHGAGAPQRDARTGAVLPAPLDGSLVTLAESLSDRGYATAGISSNVLLAPHMNLPQGFRHYDVRRSRLALTPRFGSLLQRVQRLLPSAMLTDRLLSAFPTVFRPAAEITDTALSWLGRRPGGQPYFLFLNYMDAHTPFVRHPGFSGRWPGRSPRLPSFGLRGMEPVMAGRRTLTVAEREHLRALYDDALSYLDHHLARLLAALDAQPDRDRTWVIVTADHGEALGEHERLGHDCVLTQQVLHVPLIVRYPRAAPEAARHGQLDERPVQLTDLAPAILAAAGAAPPRRVTPSSQGTMVASVDCFCWPAHPKFHAPAGQTVLQGGLKYVEERDRPPALYDLVADPAEAHDVAAARPQDVQRLSHALEQWRAGLVPSPALSHATRDAAREEALRALGYVH
jgi:arylsulfatase A-like enzyme